jgi:hypothetical protein
LKAVERKAALGADTKADTAKLEQQVAAQGTENKAHVQSQDSGVSVTGKPLPPNPIAPKPTQKET